MKGAMDNQTGQTTIISTFFGLMGGGTHFILQINTDVPFWIKFGQAVFTALVCGMVGAAGKYTVEWVKKKFFK